MMKLKGRLVDELNHEQVINDLHSGMTYHEVAAKHLAFGEPVSYGTIWRIARHYNKLKNKDVSLTHLTAQIGRRFGWACGRPTAKYKGAYPNGLLKRIDALMEITEKTKVLHLFSGSITGRENEDTMDIQEENEPTFVADARERFPIRDNQYDIVIADPPYDMEESGTGKTVTVDYSDKLWKTEFIRPYAFWFYTTWSTSSQRELHEWV
jgi:hypothetical protein